MKIINKIIAALCAATMSISAVSSFVGAIEVVDLSKLSENEQKYVGELNDQIKKVKTAYDKLEDLIELRLKQKKLSNERYENFCKLLEKKKKLKPKYRDMVAKMNNDLGDGKKGYSYDWWQKQADNLNKEIAELGLEIEVIGWSGSDGAFDIKLKDNGELEAYLGVEEDSEQIELLEEMLPKIKKMQESIDLLDKQRLVQFTRLIAFDVVVSEPGVKACESLLRGVIASNIEPENMRMSLSMIDNCCNHIDNIFVNNLFVFDNKNDVVDNQLEKERKEKEEQERLERERKGKEKQERLELEKEYHRAGISFWNERNEFIKWRNDNKYGLAQEKYSKDTTRNKRQWLEKHMLPLSNNNKLSVDQMKQYIEWSQRSIDEMRKFRTSCNQKRFNIVSNWISSLNNDIKKTEKEKEKFTKEVDNKIVNMKNEILNFEALIKNSREYGVRGVQINALSYEVEQKRKELSNLQKQKLYKVTEYNKKIKANSDKLNWLNNEYNELLIQLKRV